MRGKKDWKLTLLRWIITLSSLLVALIPTWLYILARVVFSPEGFWQQLVLGTVFIFLLGGFQLTLLILFIVWLTAVWD